MSTVLQTRSVEDLWFDVGGYTVRRMTADETGELPDGFRAVYGDDYLSETVYDAAALADVVASGNQVSYLARDPQGRLAGHIALARCTPNPELWEMGQAIVLPDHRKSGIFRWLFQAALTHATRDPGCVGLFATSLTTHVVSRKVCSEAGFKDVGLEIDYVPRRMLVKEGARGAIATIVQYMLVQEAAAEAAFVPAAYRDWVAGLLATVGACGPVHVPDGDGRFAGAVRHDVADPRPGGRRLRPAAAQPRTRGGGVRPPASAGLRLQRGAAAVPPGRGTRRHALPQPGYADPGEIRAYSGMAQELLAQVHNDWATRPIVESARTAA